MAFLADLWRLFDMYAIIETGGKQFRVRREGRVRVPSLRGEVGDRVTFDRVLYLQGGGTEGGGEREEVAVGSPLVEGARVVGEIVRHGRAPKIIVFKYKRRHRYRRTQGHRQDYTEVAITGFELGAGERQKGIAAGEEPAEGERRALSGRTAPATGAAAASRRGGAEPEATDVGTEGGAGKVRQAGPYVCEECGRGFATERGLQQHRAKTHVE